MPPSLRDGVLADPDNFESNYAGLRAGDMGEVRKSWNSGRLTNEINPLLIEEAGLRTAAEKGDQSAGLRADTLRQQIEGLERQRGQYAPAVGRVEDINWSPGRAIDYAAGQIGQGAASMLDPIAASAGLQAVGRVAGLSKHPVAQAISMGAKAGSYLVPGYMSQRQQAGETYGSMLEDPELMARTTAEERQNTANISGAVQAIPDTVLPTLIGGRLAGKGLTQGISKLPTSLRVAGDLTGEAAGEVFQEYGKQSTLGYLNPNRDTSGDASDLLNAGVGAFVGAAPISGGSHLVDSGFRRAGATARGGADLVQDAAGTVRDLYNEHAADKVNGVVQKAKDKVIDMTNYVADDEGKITPASVLSGLKTAAQDLGPAERSKATDEEKAFYAGLPPEDVLAGPDTGVSDWFNKRAGFISERLDALAADDPSLQELNARVKAGNDEVALDDAAEILSRHSEESALERYAAGAGSVLSGVGKAAGKGLVAAGKAALSVGKDIVGGVREGVKEGRKKNAQSLPANEEFTYSDWRKLQDSLSAEPLAKGASYNRSVEFATRAKTAADYAASVAAKKRARSSAVPSLARRLAFEVADMSTGFSTNSAQSAVRAAPVGKETRLNRITSDLNQVYGPQAEEVVDQLGQILGPTHNDVIRYLKTELAEQNKPDARRRTEQQRAETTKQLQALIPQDKAQALLAQDVNPYDPAAGEHLLSTVEKLARGYFGNNSRDVRAGLEHHFGKEAVAGMISVINGVDESRQTLGNEQVDDRGTNTEINQDGLNGVGMDENGEWSYDAGDAASEFAQRRAEKDEGASSTPTVYGVAKSPKLLTGDPFQRKGGKRPKLFTADDKLFDKTGALASRKTNMRNALGKQRNNTVVGQRSALEVMKSLGWDDADRKPSGDQRTGGAMVQAFVEYLGQEAHDLRAQAKNHDNGLTDTQRQALYTRASKLDAEATKHAAALKDLAGGGGGKSTALQRIAAVSRAQQYFGARYLAVAESGDRDASNMSFADLYTMEQAGAKALENAKKYGGDQGVSDANLMHLYKAEEAGDVQQTTIRIGDLVKWVRAHRREKPVGKEQEKDYSPDKADEAYLADVMHGISIMMDSGLLHETMLPYKLNAEGNPEKFRKGAPPSMKLVTRTAGQLAAEKNAAATEGRDKVRKGEYMIFLKAYWADVAEKEAKVREAEADPYVHEEIVEAARAERAAALKAAHAAAKQAMKARDTTPGSKYMARLTKAREIAEKNGWVDHSRREMSDDEAEGREPFVAELAGSEIEPEIESLEQTEIQRRVSPRKTALLGQTASVPKAETRTRQASPDASAAVGPQKPGTRYQAGEQPNTSEPKTGRYEATPLDFFGPLPEGAVPDEFADQQYLSRNTKADTTALGAESPMNAMSGARARAGQIIGRLMQDMDAGTELILSRMRSAMRSSRKEGLSGGTHYAAALAALVSPETSSVRDTSKPTGTKEGPSNLRLLLNFGIDPSMIRDIRRVVAEAVLEDKDTTLSLPNRVAITKLMANDPANVTAQNFRAKMSEALNKMGGPVDMAALANAMPGKGTSKGTPAVKGEKIERNPVRFKNGKVVKDDNSSAEEDGASLGKPQRGGGKTVEVSESSASGYRERTKHNADSAGVTVAIAINYATAGERLTKNVAGNKYIALGFDKDPRVAGKELASFMKERGTTTLNVAGNGIYTLAADGWTQDVVNQHVYAVLAEANRRNPITKIVSGGQTGVDIAGAVAAKALGIPATITLPKGYVQRNAAGVDQRVGKAAVEQQIEQGAKALTKGDRLENRIGRTAELLGGEQPAAGTMLGVRSQIVNDIAYAERMKGRTKAEVLKQPNIVQLLSDLEQLAKAGVPMAREVLNGAMTGIDQIFSQKLDTVLELDLTASLNSAGAKGKELSEFMSLLEKSKLPASTKAIARAVRKVAGAVRVSPITTAAAGDDSTHGYFKPSSAKIFISPGARNFTFAHTILHEGVHAATVRAVDDNPALHQALYDLMEHIAGHNPQLASAYGMTNTLEFLAEGMSNIEFQRALYKIPASKAVEKYLGASVANAWAAFVALVRTAMNLSESHTSALTQLLELGGQAMKGTSGTDMTASVANIANRPVVPVARAQQAVDSILLSPHLDNSAVLSLMTNLRKFLKSETVNGKVPHDVVVALEAAAKSFPTLAKKGPIDESVVQTLVHGFLGQTSPELLPSTTGEWTEGRKLNQQSAHRPLIIRETGESYRPGFELKDARSGEGLSFEHPLEQYPEGTYATLADAEQAKADIDAGIKFNHTSAVDEIFLVGRVWDLGPGLTAVEAKTARLQYEDPVAIAKGKVYFEFFDADGNQESGWLNSLLEVQQYARQQGHAPTSPTPAKDWFRGAEDVPFNKQNNPSTPATPEQIAEAKAYVKKVLGPHIKVDFEDITGYSGEWIEAADTIKIAMASAPGAMQVAYHEALHGFFSRFVKDNPQAKDILASLVETPEIYERLKALLHEHPAAIEQLKDGEERLAYAYQFWAAGMLDLPAGKPTTLFQKIKRFFAKVFGRVTDSQRAMTIIEAFHSGEFAKDPSYAGQVMTKAIYEGTWTTNQLRKMDAGVQRIRSLTMPASSILGTSDSPTARKLASMFWTNPGEAKDGEHGEGYLNARITTARRFRNLFDKYIRDLSPRDLDEMTKVLQQEADNLDTIAYGPQREAAKKIRALLQRFRQYMVEEKGMKMGDLGPNYFPRAWSPAALMDGQDKFIAMLVAKYADVLQAGISPNGAQTIEEVAERIHSKMVSSIIGDHLPPERDDGVLSPFFASKEGRDLSWIASSDAEPFMSKDIINTLTTYFHNGVRSAEYTSRFGPKGETLDHALKVIEKELHAVADKKVAKGEIKTVEAADKWVERQMAQTRSAVGAMEGSLGKDISDGWRSVTSWMTVYQNIRLLPMALFASVVDPLGMVARGATMSEAYDTFLRGMKEVVRDWGDMFRDQPLKRQRDEWENLALAVGSVDAALFSHHVSEEYSSEYLGKRAKKWNDAFFKANGMEAWNRASRIGATKSAALFLERHSKLPDRNHSARWLAELGLTAQDLTLGEDGRLITDKKALMAHKGIDKAQAEKEIQKIYHAINRWVEGAIITPNAAQRPSWSSDPHYSMFFHLKQFTYSFHQTIMKRAVKELEFGNLAPMGTFLWYIPVMLASDITKGLIQGGGDLPAHMKGMDLGDHMWRATERAGLLTVGQIGLDAQKDIFSLGGPAVEQAMDAFAAPLEKTALRALPANSLTSTLFK